MVKKNEFYYKCNACENGDLPCITRVTIAKTVGNPQHHAPDNCLYNDIDHEGGVNWKYYEPEQDEIW